ncbi:MAG: cytochrome ubiquinol oxidase subunit I [Acidimicrobiia bacterium]
MTAVTADAPSTLLPARWQMTVSLGSHIILSCFGVAFPLIIWVMHGRGLGRGDRAGDPTALELAQRWSKVAAVLFAVGAVSGTVLSFEMGLLWPSFMRTYGDVIGLPFALEGIAFFAEAIFLGLYLYGWGRLPARLHRRLLVPIAVAGVVGTFCILAVNAWMNDPSGFTLVDGKVTGVEPLAAMFNDALWMQFVHMWVAAVMVVGFLVAAVYARGMLVGRRDHHHRLGFSVPFAFAAVAAIAQPITGHLAGLRLADGQPSKLAAMELAATTESRAPMRIGGVFVDGEPRYAVEIPWLGSLIARNSPDASVPGFDVVALEDRMDDGLVTTVHLAFQAMVAIGTGLMVASIWYLYQRRRGHDPLARTWFLWFAVVAGPAAVAALEFGWITTEVGRQPWIVYGVMRIEEAVATGNNVWVTFVVLCVLYIAMITGSVLVLRSMARRWRNGEGADLPTPYSHLGSHEVHA